LGKIKYSLELVEACMVARLSAKNDQEVADKFGLTSKQFKCLMSRGYKKFPKLRKVKRSPLTFDDQVSLLRLSGFLNREEIKKKIGKHQKYLVKDFLRFKCANSMGKFLNGCPTTWMMTLIPQISHEQYKAVSVKTNSGPAGYKFKLIPWVVAYDLAKKYCQDEFVLICFRSLAKYQKFIFSQKTTNKVLAKIRDSLHDKTPEIRAIRSLQHKKPCAKT
jgi:hypothetical protein